MQKKTVFVQVLYISDEKKDLFTQGFDCQAVKRGPVGLKKGGFASFLEQYVFLPYPSIIEIQHLNPRNRIAPAPLLSSDLILFFIGDENKGNLMR